MVPKSDMKADQMNGLYPIIRRVRRPLVVLSSEPAAHVPTAGENALAEVRDAAPSVQPVEVPVENDVTVAMEPPSQPASSEPEKGKANAKSKKPRK